MNNKKQVAEQIQEDILSILSGFGVDASIDPVDYNDLVNALCESVITNINGLTENNKP